VGAAKTLESDGEFVTISDVEVLRKTAFGIECRVGDVEVFVPVLMIWERRFLDATNHRLSLTVPRWFAVASGIV
jgi:hypothetical protein